MVERHGWTEDKTDSAFQLGGPEFRNHEVSFCQNILLIPRCVSLGTSWEGEGMTCNSSGTLLNAHSLREAPGSGAFILGPPAGLHACRVSLHCERARSSGLLPLTDVKDASFAAAHHRSAFSYWVSGGK